MHQIIISLLAVFFLTSCQQSPEPKAPSELLQEAQRTIDEAQSISFTKHLVYDNAFIGSADTMQTNEIFYRNEASPIGYDFLAEDEAYTFYLIGELSNAINHEERRITSYTAEETKSDYEDPRGSMIVSNAPFYLLSKEEWVYDSDTIFQGQPARMYAYIDYENREDSVHYLRQARLFLDPETGQPLGHQTYLAANGAPHQIITCWYEDYRTDQEEPLTFVLPEGYTKMSNEEYEAGRQAGVLTVGELAPDFSATTITGEEFTLSDYRGKKVLLDFSFVGCGGCEMAMKEFNHPDFKLPDDMVGVYLSHLNTTAEIKKHFAEKGMPFLAIPRAERPNKDYGVYLYPTFFVIDKQGVIERVELGYDQGFGATL
ncbi:peroxiredoxin family protein [Neolewinella persica]|uniref:peroxiredoxin family protein n=1 Tax=Neolewinella persica TaxID=70998 RepID=UPI0003724506|nr:TlpA disulfide reductase family protein [Neolewinella persica]